MDIDRSKINYVFLGILVLVAVGVVLKYAQGVVLPLVIAWLLSYIIGPAVDIMVRNKVPTALAVGFILILLLFVLYLSGIFLYGRISAFAAAYPEYQTRLSDLVTAVTGRLDLAYDPFAGIDWGKYFGRFVVSLSGSLFAFLSKLVMVIIFLFFILIGRPYFKYKIQRSFSAQNAEQISHITNSITAQIRRYLSIQFLISFSTGALMWLVLEMIGVDFAITWGAMAVFLNFIPTIGSIFASIPPILLALVQFYPDLWPGILTLLCVATIQMVIGNGIAPKLMGDQLNLSPVVVLLSLLFWGWLWGIAGAILSVPIAAAIKIVCENIETLHPVSVMMGSGKPYSRQLQKRQE